MASPEIDAFLARCPSPDNGCFASDPDALDTMLNFGGDSGIRTDLQRVASASTDAAEADIPLDEATYEPVQIEVASSGGISAELRRRLMHLQPSASRFLFRYHRQS